jgi:hypothetical protein
MKGGTAFTLTVAAFFLGLLCGSHFSKTPSAALQRSQQSPSTVLSGTVTAPAENFEPKSKSTSGATVPSLDVTDRIAFITKYPGDLNIWAFDNDLKLSPQVDYILNLTKEEHSALERDLTQVKLELDRLQDARTSIADQTSNSVTYEIPALANSQELRNKLSVLITQDIGIERAAFFLRCSDTSFNGPLADFAQEERSVKIEWVIRDNKPLYKFVESDPFESWSQDNYSPDLPKQFQKYLPTVDTQ